MMIEDALLDSGATTVAIASTEAEAIDAAAARLPAFISSDVNLLEGTGPDAVRTILEAHGTIPVLYITATPEECRHCSPADVLRKPFSSASVSSQFHRLTGF